MSNFQPLEVVDRGVYNEYMSNFQPLEVVDRGVYNATTANINKIILSSYHA